MNDSSDKIVKTVVIFGENSETIKHALEKILKPHLQEKEEVLTIEGNLENIEEIRSSFQGSSFLVLVLNQLKDFSIEKIKPVVEAMAGQGFLLVNSEKQTIGQMKGSISVPVLSFGLEEGLDFYASDLKVNGGINFKMNYLGKSVPIWLEKSKWGDKMSGALAVVAVATVFGLNLVEISEALKGPDKA